MPSKNVVTVFAYGTLRPPQASSEVEDSRYYFQVESLIRSVVPARLAEAELYDLGSYPAARSGTGTILGELIAFKAEALPILDRIEGHPRFYRREKATVDTDEGPVEAWVYWAPDGITTYRPRIESGDWLHRPPAGFDEIPDEVPAPDPELRALVRKLAESATSWITTASTDGLPHATPIWHVWHRGRAYIVVASSSIKARNIESNPAIVLTHPDTIHPVILRGWATAANRARTQLAPLFQNKYDWDIETEGNYDLVIEITPTRLLSWDESGQQRWSGDEVMKVWEV